MNPSDFKKLLEKALDPIKETQKGHGETLKSLNSSVAAIEETLESLSSSVVTMETTINVYGDMYKINDDNSRKLEKRVETLEYNADIEPPPELTLLKVQ